MGFIRIQEAVHLNLILKSRPLFYSLIQFHNNRNISRRSGRKQIHYANENKLQYIKMLIYYTIELRKCISSED